MENTDTVVSLAVRAHTAHTAMTSVIELHAKAAKLAAKKEASVEQTLLSLEAATNVGVSHAVRRAAALSPPEKAFALRNVNLGARELALALPAVAAHAAPLKSISFWHVGLDAEAYQLLAAALPSSLDALALEGDGPTSHDAEPRAVAPLLKLASLRSLSLRCSAVEPAAAESLRLGEALRANRALTSISLYGCALGDIGAAPVLAALRHNSRLLALDLGQNRLTDASATSVLAAFADVPPASSARTVAVRNTDAPRWEGELRLLVLGGTPRLGHVLALSAIEASGVPAADAGSDAGARSSDPYVRATIATTSAAASPGSSNTLEFSLWDKDWTNEDDPLGSVTVPLPAEPSGALELELSPAGSGAPALALRCRYRWLGAALPDLLVAAAASESLELDLESPGPDTAAAVTGAANRSLTALSLASNSIEWAGALALEAAQAASPSLVRLETGGNPLVGCGPCASLTASQRARIRAGWATLSAVPAHGETAAVKACRAVLADVYHWLPGATGGDDQAGGGGATDETLLSEMARKVALAVSSLVSALDTPAELYVPLLELGKTANLAGVPPLKPYDELGAALLRALEGALPAEGATADANICEWSADAREAWAAALAAASAVMQHAYTRKQLDEAHAQLAAERAAAEAEAAATEGEEGAAAEARA